MRLVGFVWSLAALSVVMGAAEAQKLSQAETPHYVASWATSVQGAEPAANQPPADSALLTDVTIRQVVHLSAGGIGVRIVFSNAFGTEPLTIDDVHVAQAVKPGSSAIVPGTDKPVAFGGGRNLSVTIPVGAEYVSYVDAVQAKPLSDLAISFHRAQPPAGQSAHPGSHATSFLVHGDHSADTELTGATASVGWFQLAEVEVTTDRRGQTVVALGDSITDGHASVTDANNRWPDFLASRIQAAGMADVAVANEGIGGNHLLTNGTGQSALERLDRDLFGLPAVRTVIVLEGINDLGALSRQANTTPAQHADLVNKMEGAYLQILQRAQAHGMRVIGTTLTPYVGSDYYHPGAASEADRVAINAWIRQPGHFDAVVDFDKVVRDPAHPERMLPAFDSGDHLHPGPAGYKAMGGAIPLALLR